jgi:hypothetical protein
LSMAKVDDLTVLKTARFWNPFFLSKELPYFSKPIHTTCLQILYGTRCNSYLSNGTPPMLRAPVSTTQSPKTMTEWPVLVKFSKRNNEIMEAVRFYWMKETIEKLSMNRRGGSYD